MLIWSLYLNHVKLRSEMKICDTQGFTKIKIVCDVTGAYISVSSFRIAGASSSTYKNKASSQIKHANIVCKIA